MFYETVYNHGLGETKAEMLARGCSKVSTGLFTCPPLIAGTATGGPLLAPTNPVAPIVPILTTGPTPVAVEPVATGTGILDTIKSIPTTYLLIGAGVVAFYMFQQQKKGRP